jgi:hypothetical protein
MDMILLDWTRMGRQYCLAGAVVGAEPVRIVRPLLGKHRDAPVRNCGWSAYLMDGHSRWDVFELIGPEPADPEPPHLEDLWIRSLRPHGRSATREQRRAILAATTAPAGQPVFGQALTLTHSTAHLTTGQGQRSLATVVVPAAGIRFSASLREGAAEPDVRASLGIVPLGARLLPVKDHHLLLRAESAATNLTALARCLESRVHAMGPELAVRLGLSRPFQNDPERSPEACWLMIDGFFSLADPQA